jgi:hypothetical protein
LNEEYDSARDLERDRILLGKLQIKYDNLAEIVARDQREQEDMKAELHGVSKKINKAEAWGTGVLWATVILGAAATQAGTVVAALRRWFER